MVNSLVPDRFNSPVRATFPLRASSNSNSILWCCSEIGVAIAAPDIAAGKPRKTAGAPIASQRFLFSATSNSRPETSTINALLSAPSPSRCGAQST